MLASPSFVGRALGSGFVLMRVHAASDCCAVLARLRREHRTTAPQHSVSEWCGRLQLEAISYCAVGTRRLVDKAPELLKLLLPFANCALAMNVPTAGSP